MVAGDHDERLALDLVEVLARQLVLVLEAERREVARADHDVRLELVDLADRAVEQARLEVLLAAVQVGEVRDAEGAGAVRHGRSLRRGRPPVERAVREPEYRSPVRSETHRFQAYRGTEPPRFANRIELECARILDWYAIPWEYEPTSFVLERDAEGRVTRAFTPDFFLPDENLYIEVTVMKQSLVTRKNRKLRELREQYPDVNVKLFYRRDLERLAQRYRLKLAS